MILPMESTDVHLWYVQRITRQICQQSWPQPASWWFSHHPQYPMWCKWLFFLYNTIRKWPVLIPFMFFLMGSYDVLWCFMMFYACKWPKLLSWLRTMTLRTSQRFPPAPPLLSCEEGDFAVLDATRPSSPRRGPSAGSCYRSYGYPLGIHIPIKIIGFDRHSLWKSLKIREILN